MKHTTGWFSIILALWLMLILSLTGLYLLEYMVPFSRNVKGIENASKAFYQSYGALENSIIKTYSWAKSTRWYEPNPIEFTNVPLWSSSSVISSGSTIPFAWRGNSEIDSDWNQLSLTKPISLFVWNNRFSSPTKDMSLSLRVPDFNGATLQNTNDIILWQLNSSTWSLSARDLLHLSNSSITTENLFTESGYGLDSITTPINFIDFYNNSCGIWQECILKISVVQPLLKSGWWIFPYLEYQINSNITLPFQESYIRAGWKSYGFRKKLEVVLPHRTTSSAFDFTVLQ